LLSLSTYSSYIQILFDLEGCTAEATSSPEATPPTTAGQFTTMPAMDTTVGEMATIRTAGTMEDTILILGTTPTTITAPTTIQVVITTPTPTATGKAVNWVLIAPNISTNNRPVISL
jgi:hypothetical protein